MLKTQQPPSIPAPPDIGAIRGPVEIATGTPWAWWIAVGAAITVAGTVIFFLLRKRNTPRGSGKRLRPHESALAALAEARSLEDDADFATRSIHAIKTFCADGLGFDTTGKTSSELLAAARAIPSFTEQAVDDLERLLGSTESVQFARASLSQDEREEILALSENWIRSQQATEQGDAK